MKFTGVCDSAVVPSANDLFELTLPTSDDLGEFTYEIPACHVENGKYYTMDVTLTADNYTNYEEVKAADRQALIELYNACGGDEWTNNENWCSDVDISEWYGVSAYDDMIKGLNLSSNNLVGDLVISEGALSQLSSVK